MSGLKHGVFQTSKEFRQKRPFGYAIMMAIPCHAQENHWLTMVNQWFFSVFNMFNSTKGKIVNQGRPPNACAAAWNDWWKAVVLGVPPLQPRGMSGGVQCAIFWANRKGHLKIIWYKWQYNMILHGAIIWYYMCISNKLCHIYIYIHICCHCHYMLLFMCIWTVYMDDISSLCIIWYTYVQERKLSCQLPQTIIADYKNGKPVRSYWMVHDGPIPPSLPAKCWSSLITLNMWTRHAVQQDGNNQGVLYLITMYSIYIRRKMNMSR